MRQFSGAPCRATRSKKPSAALEHSQILWIISIEEYSSWWSTNVVTSFLKDSAYSSSLVFFLPLAGTVPEAGTGFVGANPGGGGTGALAHGGLNGVWIMILSLSYAHVMFGRFASDVASHNEIICAHTFPMCFCLEMKYLHFRFWCVLWAWSSV